MRTIALALLLLGSSALAKETTYNGNTIETESELRSIKCSEGNVETYIEHWPPKYEMSPLCDRGTLGFHGMCLYTTWENTLVRENGDRVSLPKLHELHKDKGLLLEDRYYVETPKFCNENKIYFSLWSGGNCENGCEAFGFVEIGESNQILGSDLIPYSVFKEKEQTSK